MYQPQIAATFLKQLLVHLEEHSVDAQRLLVSHNIDPGVLEEPDAMVPMGSFFGLIEAGVAATGDQNLGLHIYQSIDFRDVGTFGYVILNSGRLADVLDASSRFYRLFQTDTDVRIEHDGEDCRVIYSVTAPGMPYSRQDSEMSLMFIVQFIRRFAGEDWRPDAAYFQHPAPSDISEHKRLLCDTLFFDQPENAMTFPSATLDVPIPRADGRLSRALQATMERLLAARRAETGDNFIRTLERSLMKALPAGVPGMDAIASDLAMSGRTLQRRLAEQKVNFKDLIEQLRREMSINYIRASDLSMTEIAYLLGYSDLRSFDRAFKRWTGDTPFQYRTRLRPTGSAGE